MLEQQLDLFADMDAGSLYDSCMVTGIMFRKNDIKKLKDRAEMLVVDARTQTDLFAVTISQQKTGYYYFSFSALDGYWANNYWTHDLEEIKKSLSSLSADIRKEWGRFIG